MTAKMLQQK